MKILKKENLYKLLEAATSKYKLITPQKKLWEDILFEESGPIAELPQGYVLPYNSLKDFFFPQSETLFPKEIKKEKKSLFFGVRPCDIKALNFQDLFFGRKPEDSYYLSKRKNSLIISVACNTPAKSCFCLFSRTGPYLDVQDNFDLQFTDLGDEFIVETGNKKGESFILAYNKFFQEGSAAQEAHKFSCHQKCKMKMEASYDMAKITEKLNSENLDELWKELGFRCTNCGGCEFICPTCFCFNIQDQTFGKEATRKRSWDSCTYEGYSRMAGGANPYEKREYRIKKRFYCKLYHAQKWFNMYACVGCGRCTSVCPVNLEMESFINSLKDSNTYKSLLKGL